MSTHEPDGIAEAFDELLRAGLLLGTRVAERHLREREQQLRDAAGTSLDRARAAHEHHQAARRAAIASLEDVHSDSWWRHASARDVRQAWITAREYQHEDPHAARAVWTIADQLAQRHGLDVHQVDPAAFGTQPELGEHTTLTDTELQAYDRRLRRELAELAAEYSAANPADRQPLDDRMREIDELRGVIGNELADRPAPPEPSTRDASQRRDARNAVIAAGGDDTPTYDSTRRRTKLAARLRELDMPPQAIEAAMLADTGQAFPPEMATASPAQDRPGRPAPARRTTHRQRKRGR
jgi:hypothetical protein